MLRRTTSLTLAFSGLVMLITSVVLFFGPAGHVGHFSPWSFCGLTRHHWTALHINSGGLFCLVMLIHTWINWKLLATYIKKRQRKRAALWCALALTLFVCVGGYFEFPPMQPVLNIARATRKHSIQKYGSPPYGSAEKYPIAMIAGYMGWNPKKSIEQLKEHSISVESPTQALSDVARQNQKTIGQLLDIMQNHCSENQTE